MGAPGLMTGGLIVAARASAPLVQRLGPRPVVTAGLAVLCFAERTGRDEDDLEVRVFAMGLMGALLEGVVYWAEHDYQHDLLQLIDRTLDTFKDLPKR
ncbi:hypothetical protein WBG99_12250 [Streptomyces sp. TG1A-60]|uniref:acyl-CoA-like ligand-binding transcription factor n=1 Tax=Streptomyces sp. TG1A-60 TaxID=3129111 RepID=UPI0030CAD40E